MDIRPPSTHRAPLRAFLTLVPFVVLAASSAIGQPTIEIGSTAEFPGTIEVTFDSGGAEVVSIEHEIVFPPETQLTTCRLGADLFGLAELTISFNPPGCDVGRDCASLAARVVAIGGQSIPDDAQLYHCRTLSFAASEEQRVPLSCGDLEVVDVLDRSIDADCVGGTVTVPAAQVHVAIGTTTITPTGRGQLDVTLELLAPGVQVVGVENLIAFDPAILIEDCEVGPTIFASYGFSLGPQGCVPGVDCASLLALVLDFLGDPRPFPDGDVVYRCDVSAVPVGSSAAIVPSVPTDTLATTFPLRCMRPGSVARSGSSYPTTCADGAVIIAEATSTSTPTRTSIPTPTTTPPPTIHATETVTRMAATATPQPDPTGTHPQSTPTATPSQPTLGDGGGCAIRAMPSDRLPGSPWIALAIVWICFGLTKVARRLCWEVPRALVHRAMATEIRPQMTQMAADKAVGENDGSASF